MSKETQNIDSYHINLEKALVKVGFPENLIIMNVVFGLLMGLIGSSKALSSKSIN